MMTIMDNLSYSIEPDNKTAAATKKRIYTHSERKYRSGITNYIGAVEPTITTTRARQSEQKQRHEQGGGRGHSCDLCCGCCCLGHGREQDECTSLQIQ